MATAKITAAQRKYFVERIESSITDKVRDLEHQRASKVQTISEGVFRKYLESAGVVEDLDLYEVCDTEHRVINRKLVAVYDEIKRTFDENNRESWKSHWPSIYNGSDHSTIKDAFRYACNQLSKKNEDETPEGKMINMLNERKRQALDEIHGVNELLELKESVNNILGAVGVPLLGDSDESHTQMD